MKSKTCLIATEAWHCFNQLFFAAAFVFLMTLLMGCLKPNIKNEHAQFDEASVVHRDDIRNAYRESEAVRSSVSRGMNEEEVLSAIGHPSQIITNNERGGIDHVYVYFIRRDVYFKINFDKHDCVVGTEFSGLDEMFDRLGIDNL